MYTVVIVFKSLITRPQQTLDTRVPVHIVDLSILFGWGSKRTSSLLSI